MVGDEDEAAKARLLAEARVWMARLDAAPDTAPTRCEFMAWIAADPRHECAFRAAARADPCGEVEPADTASDSWVGDLAAGFIGIEGAFAGDGGELDAAFLGASLRCEGCGHALHDDGVLSAHAGPSFAAATAIAAEAAGWAERLAAGVSPADYEALHIWLRREPGHGLAFARALSAVASRNT